MANIKLMLHLYWKRLLSYWCFNCFERTKIFYGCGVINKINAPPKLWGWTNTSHKIKRKIIMTVVQKRTISEKIFGNLPDQLTPCHSWIIVNPFAPLRFCKNLHQFFPIQRKILILLLFFFSDGSTKKYILKTCRRATEWTIFTTGY